MSNINLTTLFNTLGVVGGNTASTNQYEFFNGVEWSDGTFTYNQYEFFKKAAGSRYDFFKNYESERAFYKAIDDERIYDFYTFYKYAGEYLSSALFIDLFGAPDVAFSVRKLNSAYTGAALRVRKSGDEKDIGFVGNDLDTADILDFVGSQNLFPDSEDASDFSNQVGVTITTNTLDTTDPLGGNTADKVVGTGSWLLRDNLTNVTSGKTYTISVWVKAVSGSATFRFIVGNALTSNITTTDEWVRYSATIVSTGTATGIIRDSSSNPIEAYFWGFQISEGSELQDYIKTDGAVNLGTGYVSKWYDQSGNGNDVTISDSTEQPLIMENGLLKVDANGITAPYLDGVNDQFENILDITSKENLFIITTTSKADWGSTYSTGAILGAANNQFLRFNGDLTRLEARIRNINYDGTFDTVKLSTLSSVSAGDDKTRIIGFYNYNKADFVAGSPSGNDYEFAVFEYDTLGSTVSTTDLLDSGSIANGIDIGTRNPSAAADWFKGFIHEVIIYTGESELYRSDFTIDTDGWLVSNGAISATSSALRFVPDTSALQHFTRIVPGFEADKTYKVVGEVYVPSSVTTFTKVRIWTAFSAEGYIDIDTKDAWTKFNITMKPSDGGSLRVQPIPDFGIGFTGNDSDYIEVRGVIIDEVLDDMKDKVNNLSDINANINDYFGGYGSLLLDDVPNAAAAYSLRKLRADYSGAAVRVRRSSDPTEQDIGFDANGDLDTTALLAFVNADVTKADTDFSTGFADTAESGLDRLANQSIGGRSGVLKGTIQATIEEHRLIISVVDTAANTHRIQTSIYIPSGQSGQIVDGFRIENGGLQVYATTTTKDAWVDIDVTWTSVPNANVFIKFLTLGGAESWLGNGTDEVYIGDVTITQTTADGLVSVVYDQSGNGNNATQSIAASQMKIVDSGSLVTENGKPGFDFDGVDDYFDLSSTLVFSSDFYISSVLRFNPDSSFNVITQGLSSASRIRLYDDGEIIVRISSTDGNFTTASVNTQSLYEFSRNSSDDISVYQDSVLLSGSSSVSGNFDIFRIAANQADPPSVNQYFKGIIQEIIFYDFDQDANNRSIIEYNIANYYNI